MNALQLVSFNEEGQAILHLENLQSVLDRDEIRDRRVVAIAVAGSFRRGKSFLLNYFLRYLETKGDKSFKEDDKLSGFESKFGLDRVTTGISIWPELAVVLIDTQGTFDKETSMKVNTAVVAFNWNEGYGFSYGYDGGDGYLQHFVSSKNSNEMQSSNEMLRMCFDEVLCYLMPHPGEAVSDSQTYNGHLKDVDGTFLNYIHLLASSLLSPENLVSKRIAGELVTSGQLMHHIRACVSLFNSNELPEPKTMYNILVDEVSGANSKEAREMYCNLMKEAMKSNVLDEEQLNTIHQQNSTTAMEYFTNKQKMGSDSQKIKHKTVLHEK
ncbi:hypothetical protein B566_EDAN001641 [Ephemera danica]|nr:hypothetical protein B566_EDAN001641 [Ephemera danica]